MRRCYYICSEEANGNALARMMKDLRRLEYEAPKSFIRRFEIFSNVKRHYLLGVTQSIDIVSSIEKRFITGQASPDTTFIRSILGGRHEV